MRRKFVLRAALTVGTALLSLSSVVTAATIAPGNLVIYRVGDGSAALTAVATSVFLDEYTTAGSLVQSIPLTSSGGGAFTAGGNATTEGIISPSQDGTSLVFTGYRKAAGGTAPASDTYTVTSRVIGTVTLAGTPDLTTVVSSDNGAATANAIRSATTVNGSAYWIANASRVSYFGSATGTTGGTVQIDARNSRQVNLADSILYASNGSTTIAAKVQSYGTTPTGATAGTAVVTQALLDAVNGFVLLDLSASVAGADTLYALNTVTSQLLKYTYNGSTWSATGSIASSASNITGQVSGGLASLYFTTGAALISLTDSSGYGGTLSGTPTSIATAAANTGFRGIGTLTVPEPSSLVLVSLGCCIAFVRRRTVRG